MSELDQILAETKARIAREREQRETRMRTPRPIIRVYCNEKNENGHFTVQYNAYGKWESLCETKKMTIFGEDTTFGRLLGTTFEHTMWFATRVEVLDAMRNKFGAVKIEWVN